MHLDEERKSSIINFDVLDDNIPTFCKNQNIYHRQDYSNAHYNSEIEMNQE